MSGSHVDALSARRCCWYDRKRFGWPKVSDRCACWGRAMIGSPRGQLKGVNAWWHVLHTIHTSADAQVCRRRGARSVSELAQRGQGGVVVMGAIEGGTRGVSGVGREEGCAIAALQLPSFCRRVADGATLYPCVRHLNPNPGSDSLVELRLTLSALIAGAERPRRTLETSAYEISGGTGNSFRPNVLALPTAVRAAVIAVVFLDLKESTIRRQAVGTVR